MGSNILRMFGVSISIEEKAPTFQDCLEYACMPEQMFRLMRPDIHIKE